ncbi:cell division protein SepF [Leptolyngbya ohadii]|uniref:cell division protein SepF n=1 Tax=Leptolyngbya ohadii TaxID=1962290 RepID=UPI000B59FE49|nr:cell division protein SepF [Leptolyngbya ohadii]
MVQGILPTAIENCADIENCVDIENHESQLYSQIAQGLEKRKIIYLQEFLHMGEQLRNVVDLASRSGRQPEIILIEIQTFYQVTLVIEALRAQKAVCLNLSLIDAETAQRVIDFLMGGAYAIDCQPTCIGEEVFLLTPDRVVLSQGVLSQPQEQE